MITVEIDNSCVRKTIKALTEQHKGKLKTVFQITGDKIRKKVLEDSSVASPPEKERIIR